MASRSSGPSPAPRGKPARRRFPRRCPPARPGRNGCSARAERPGKRLNWEFRPGARASGQCRTCRFHYKGGPAMGSGFKGFPEEGMAFFRGLARNNRREWFLPRKQVYEDLVKAPMVELVEALNASMLDFAPAYVTDPDKAIFRIYRDVRFSADKTPYKTHIAATFSRRGSARHAAAGYY